ncbi:MAG: glucans biosynthesis glucosyltransferase MdoH, partial [Paracoccaceae bacterium]|nr:glucans biosynthesis glucosyltransferase MdoH [Paracoccaceae bacterium]
LQQMIAVLRTAAGYRETWVPQRRGVEPYPVGVLWRFHALETLTGLALVGGMAAGAVSLWLLPIAASLMLAVPLSALSGLDMTARRWTRRHLATPQSQNPPQVIRDAMGFRTRIGNILAGTPMPESLTGVAAE